MLKREFKFVGGNDCIGSWGLYCDDCPLLPHLKALGMKPKACVSGIQTNCQGAIPMGACEHYQKDSAKSQDGKDVIECNHKESTPC